MKKRLIKLPLLLATIAMMFSFTSGLTVVSAETNASDKFVIVHTNDMHGRLDEKLRGADTDHTKLARLKYFVQSNNATLVVDGGDAIQGLPISNLNEGKYMLDAMFDIGYDAMAVGNHEFDFGLPRAKEVRDYILANGNGMKLLSANVQHDGSLVFEPYMTLTKQEKDIAIIGLTTPETTWKTHPNNVKGVTFLEPFAQAEKYVKEAYLNNNELDLLILNVHLGTEEQTANSWNGESLAKHMSTFLTDNNIDVPLLVIDGHSHTPENNNFGGNVLYVQTGGTLDSIGLVEVDFTDITKSKASLTKIEEVKPTFNYPLRLAADIAASAEFDVIGSEVLVENQPNHFNGERDFVRTRETNLGNLVTDAMMYYGKGLKDKPDLAVMNGGGLRVSLVPGPITKGDAIAVIPFGNMYSSIKVTGKDLYDMFEHSYKSPLDENMTDLDEYGNRLLGQSGGFLQVSESVKISYNPLNESGSRIRLIQIDRGDGFKDVVMDENYILATNDFLAQGGDGYNMLGGERIEGDSLDDVFARFIASGDVDWTKYEEQYNPTRILQRSLDAEDTGNTEDTDTDTPTDDKVVIPPTGIYTGAMTSMATATVAAAALLVLRKREE